METNIKLAKNILSTFNCSLVVISRNGEIRTFYNKGVRDLFTLLERDPEFMEGAVVADKMVGAGAAVLMLLGQISHLFTFIISEPALARLTGTGITVVYDRLIPNVINRTGTDICPVEKLVSGVQNLEEAHTKIRKFLS